MKYQKIDCHLHLSANGRDAQNNPMHVFNYEEMVPVYQMLGIDKAVIMPGLPDMPMAGSLVTNEQASELCRQYAGQLYWFCNLTPDGTEDTLNTLKKYKAMGAKGVGEFVTNLRLDDPIILHLLQACETMDMPFLFHMSPEENNYYGVVDFPGLPLLEMILARFPKLTVIGHSQPFWFEIDQHPDDIPAAARNIYPAGPVHEGRLQTLLRKYPNLYGDLSADSAGNALMRDPDYGIRFMNEFQDRLLFGTDMVNTDLIYPLGQYLDSLLHQGKLSETVYRKICRENAERILKL